MTVEQETLARAQQHRSLVNVAAIAVTGSCGKTTTKDLIAAVLSARYRVAKNEGTENCGLGLSRSLLAVAPDDQFLVQELGAWGPGTIDAGIALVRPKVAVVTNLRNDHYSSLHGARGAQAEKGKLVEALPPDGVAVLNGDDPLAAELATRTAARVVYFGRGPQAGPQAGAEAGPQAGPQARWAQAGPQSGAQAGSQHGSHTGIQASEVAARWPERLSFLVSHRGQRVRVQTRLVGEHLLGSALAALAVGVVLGVPLDEAAAVLGATEPTFRRMSPVVLPDGITFIRDDYKAPADSLPEVLAFMHQATATRRVAVIGRISDFPGRSRGCYTGIARAAVAALDVVLFVGGRPVELWGEHRSVSATDQLALHRQLATPSTGHRGQMLVFEKVSDADEFLRGFLRPGDLVLIKGSGPADHLERVVLSRQQTVSCWLPSCGRIGPCDSCPLLGELSPGQATKRWSI